MTDELTPLRNKALDAVIRYGLLTVKTARPLVTPDATEDAARHLLDELVKGGWLRKHKFSDRMSYYLLTARTAFARNLHRRLCTPPGYIALCRNYAMLAFCAKQGHTKFTPAEWRQTFPEFCIEGVRSNGYYLDQSDPEKPVICWMHVDAANDPFRLVAKVRNEVQRRHDGKQFEEYIRREQFAVVVLTPTEGKQRDLRKALTKRLKGKARVRVFVVEELSDVLILGRDGHSPNESEPSNAKD